MSATLLIDLSHDLDRIHAQTRMQVRQHIRVAQRRGVVVREGGQEDVETFRRLMVSLCERRGVSPTPPERDFFENLWRVFAPRGWVRIFLAEVDGQPVAGNLVLAFGDTARIWKAGWSGEFADRRPNNLVQWEAMRWAKQNGFRYFDPMGIERPLAEQLLTGANIDWAGIAGPSNFKIGYGGAPVVLPETLYRFLSPWPQLFVSIGGQRLLESSRVAQLLERINA
jgi:lipid II:glycine glycyltransferase (peptidoglycan interpeptide bridge formation enzyme)